MYRLALSLSLVGLVVAGGCDSASGDGDRAPLGPRVASVSGSVHVNDGDDLPGEGPARDPGELGIEAVRVDVVSPDGGEPVASGMTDDLGLYSIAVPEGEWVVVLTGDPSEGAFNEPLFHAYAPTFQPAEQVVVATEAAGAGADFAFDPVWDTLLDDLTEGPYRTDGRTPERWLTWVQAAQQEETCPESTEDEPWVCRADLLVYLDAIFFGPEPGDNFLGNPDPYLLGPEEDPLVRAEQILSATPESEFSELVVELFVVELNHLGGFGSPDPVYDRTLIYALEVFVGPGASEAGDARTQAPRTAASVLIQLEVARIFNRGGGGGKVGD